jgi:ATP-dependent phosphoenolpyruvate carboxykinase
MLTVVYLAQSSACVRAIAEGGLEWSTTPDFGYQVPVSVPDFSPADEGLLQPKERYAALDRMDEYNACVERLKPERRAVLESFPALDGYNGAGV